MSEGPEGGRADPVTPLVIGQYALFDELAAGGMATVHLGRLLGDEGRTVAIKRLHAQNLRDAEFVTMFMDEARIVSRIPVHPNVVSMIDLVRTDDGLYLVIDYVHGETLSRLLRSTRQSKESIPPRIVAAIMCGVLHGLHAAHETRSRDARLLNIVHRDVSPQNIMVGADGVARVVDFGIAKAAGRAQTTREGEVKGKIAYMAPEQIRGQVDRRTDVFAAGVVLWEMLAGRRMHGNAKDVDIISRMLRGTVDPPSKHQPALSAAIDALVMKGIAVDPTKRYATALELAVDLQNNVGLAAPSEISEWVNRLASDVLASRAAQVTAMEEAAAELEPDVFVVVEETSRRAPLSLPRARGARVEPAMAPATVPETTVPAATTVPMTTGLPAAVPTGPGVVASLRASTAALGSRFTALARVTKDNAFVVAVLVAFVALAVTGGVLGGYALSRPSPAPTDSARVHPSSAPAPGVVEHPVLPPRASVAAPVPDPVAARASASARAAASAGADDPPQSFSANPFMVPTPLARPNPTP